MLKKDIRKIYKDKRIQLTHTQMEKLDDLVLIQFQKLSLPYLQSLLSYWPLPEMNEINTHTITDFIIFRNPGIQIAYPVADFTEHAMKAVLTNDDTEFSPNKYGIPEPATGQELLYKDIDAVLIPLLAFDNNGYRVGYGKGFYDRFLAACSKDTLKIGLSYFEAIEGVIDDIDANDIRMDFCVTPEMVYEFVD